MSETKVPERIWVWEDSGSGWRYGGWDLYGQSDTFNRAEYVRAEPFPALGASAMQRAAESIARPNHNGKPTCACESCNQRRWVADMISNLPPPDHAALLADALLLPEIDELMRAAKKYIFENDCYNEDDTEAMNAWRAASAWLTAALAALVAK